MTNLQVFCLTKFSGAQPIVNRAQTIALSVNGEIYNHLELLEELKGTVPNIHEDFTTDSDCEILLHLFKVITTNNLSLSCSQNYTDL